ncbi:hypothetical protein BG004_007266 [Podila humilis]|nr:hypothetical protein BG004_007266 [Podila humilis]
MDTDTVEQVQSHELPLAGAIVVDSSASEGESSIPTPSFTPEKHSTSSQATSEADSVSNSEATPFEVTTAPSSPSSQSQTSSQLQRPSMRPPAPTQIKRRPRRTGQPLHLLLQDCSRQHILGSLSKKTQEEIKAVIVDKKALAADLQMYSNEFVLTTARDKVIAEVDDEGKMLLSDVSPEAEPIKKRFEDETSVFKAYEDAMHDIRVDLHLDSLKPWKEESEESSEAAARTAELNAALHVWYIYYKPIDTEPRRGGRSTQNPYPSRGGRPVGPPGTRPYAPYPSSRGPPPPHYGVPYPPPRGHHRDYLDHPPYREDYYGERREDYRRPDYERHDPREHDMDMRPPVPGAVGRPDVRDPRDFRDRGPPVPRGDHPYAAGPRFDERRRDRADSHGPSSRDSRHAGANGTPGGLSAHPSLPPKPHTNAFDNNPIQQAHQGTSHMYAPVSQHAPQQQYSQAIDPAHAAYYAQQQAYAGAASGQVDYSAYAYGYPQDPAAAAAAAAYYGAQGWDMTGAAAGAPVPTSAAAVAGMPQQPFHSGDHGRHKAVPLPTDFMSGPSEAPRLSMPEPHQVLGTIRGIIIRDAHGNIGLSQYQFTQTK